MISSSHEGTIISDFHSLPSLVACHKNMICPDLVVKGDRTPQNDHFFPFSINNLCFQFHFVSKVSKMWCGSPSLVLKPTENPKIMQNHSVKILIGNCTITWFRFHYFSSYFICQHDIFYQDIFPTKLFSVIVNNAYLITWPHN